MSERERYARQVRERLGKWDSGGLSAMQCIDRVVARADIAEQERVELIEALDAMCKELDIFSVRQPICDTDLHWHKRKARAILDKLKAS